ncbi:response regulator [Dehalogenimonas alkenigignens]|uniref:response regulator n=1 Tax=Dehalogenimonas alkenigignens TaxID=1217799 RepID=UPI000D57D84D|nr:hypothetical protein DD509_06830 [Dehalogenimonas alkenigignens]
MKLNMKILCVEEDTALFEMIRQTVLEYTDQVAINRCSPTDLVSEQSYFRQVDLVLFDLDCRTHNSLELFAAFRESTNIPIVIMDDARTGTNRLIKALHFGVSEYLLKPLSRNQLISTIISHSGQPKRTLIGG